MERSRLLQCLAADYMRLREVAGTGLNAPVPSCPGWTVTDLVRHVAQVYLHKAAVMQLSAWPDPWPPEEIATEPPIALLDRGYGALTHEFSRRADDEPAVTWHGPDQTVKFWIRRMAQESVIHRLDAELALHTEAAPIADDLAVDGIDEVLQLFLAYGSRAAADDMAPLLSSTKGRTVRIQLIPPPPPGSLTADDASPYAGTSPHGGSSYGGPSTTSTSGPASPFAASTSAFPTGTAPAWLVHSDPDAVTVTPAAGTRRATDATVSGTPEAMLRWLWSRESILTADAPPPIQVEGDEEAVGELRTLLTASTQ